MRLLGNCCVVRGRKHTQGELCCYWTLITFGNSASHLPSRRWLFSWYLTACPWVFPSLLFGHLNIINHIWHHLRGNIIFQASSGSNSLNMKADIRYLVIPPGPSAGTTLRHWVNISGTMFDKKEGVVWAGYRSDLGNCISWDWGRGNNLRKGALVTWDLTHLCFVFLFFFPGRLGKWHLWEPTLSGHCKRYAVGTCLQEDWCGSQTNKTWNYWMHTKSLGLGCV